MGFTLDELLAQKQAPPSDTPSAIQTFLASNETPRSLAMAQPTQSLAPSRPVMSADSPDTGDDNEETSPATASVPPPSSSTSAPSMGMPDMSQFHVSPEDLQSAHDQKRNITLMGALGNALGNQQSWGNFYAGKMNPHNDVAGAIAPFAAMADDDIKNKQLLGKQALTEQQNKLQAYRDAQSMQQMKEFQDPTSTASKLAKSISLGAIQQLEIPAEERGQLVDAIKNSNALQVQQLVDANPLLKQQFSATIAGKKLAQSIAMMQSNNDFKERRLEQSEKKIGMAEDTQASKAGQAVETAVAPYKKVVASLDRSDSILTGKEPVTAKTMAVAGQDFINAVAAGGAATEGKVNREMIHTLQENINDLQLHFGDVADLRKTQPQVVAHLRGLIGQVKEDYSKAMKQQQEDVAGSFATTSNQKVKDTLEGKAKRYNGEEPQSAPAMKPEDVEALQWAKANKGTPEAQQILLKISKKYPGA